MRILYLVHRFPFPPDKGDKIRSYNVLRYLAQRHQVTCACFVDDPDDLRFEQSIRDLGVELVALPLSRGRSIGNALLDLAIDESATLGFYRDARMTAAVKRVARNGRFDAVLVFSAGMAPYAEFVDTPRKVLDLCDLDSCKWADLARRVAAPRRWLYQLEARRLADAELELYQRFDATVLIAEHEARDWQGPRDRLHFVPNGVDLPRLVTTAGYRSRTLGFLGDMRYRPNEDAVRWFTDAVWPAVIDAVPNARWIIAGRHPSRQVQALARRPGVEVLGAVDDVAAVLQSWQVAVVPLRVARGLQNKVLEAMAAARPVVLTSAAAGGIGAPDGLIYDIADQPCDLASSIINYLSDPRQCVERGEAARSWVRARFDWSTSLARLETLLTGRSNKPDLQRLPVVVRAESATVS